MANVSLRQLAAKNVWQNRGRYLAYLGSAAFSVMIYFLYTALALHPNLQGGFRGADYVAPAMNAAAVVIAVFTLLFLLYSGAAFIRSRMKEFGLLSLLGFTRWQLVRMLLWENAIVAVTAIAAGLGLGLLFLKLFFMAISALLQLPGQLPVYIGWPVWRQTLIVFGSIFLVVSLLSLRGVVRRNVIELIRAGRQPLERPTFSKGKALLGTVLVIAGYVWASHPNPTVIMLGVVPVTTMVSVGTYFVLREASVALLQGIRRMHRLYRRPGPFLTVSQLMLKLQENYRILSGAAIMVAVILSTMGTIFTFYVVTEESVIMSTPQAIQLNIPDHESAAEHVAFVDETLAAYDVSGLQRFELRLPRARVDSTRVTVMPHRLYTSLYRPEGETLWPADDEHAVLVDQFAFFGGMEPESAGPSTVHIADAEYELILSTDLTGRVLNDVEDVLVISDARFEQWVSDHPDAPFRTVAVWTGSNWRGAGMEAALAQLRTKYDADSPVELTSTYEFHRASVAQFGLALFIGLFISFVFFAATCSLLYFRLFTEIDDDRRYYARLRQLGLTLTELRALSWTQALVLFLVPFLVGLVHSTFAMRALSTLVFRSVLVYGWMMAVGYFILYGAYFTVTFALYWRSMGLREHSTAPAAVT